MEKTNAIRLLDSKNIEYVIHEYNNEVTDGEEVAKLIGVDPNQCFKTLVTIGNDLNHYVYMVPVNASLNLKKAAKVAHIKKIEMIKQKELLPLTGYIHGGCSPIGMKKEFITFIDETATLFDEIYFSGGRKGINISINTNDLCKIVKTNFDDLID